MLDSSWLTRAALILSGLWIASVYLWISAQPNFGQPLVAYGVLPALLFGGGAWVWSSYRASRGATARVAGSTSEQPTTSTTPMTKVATANIRLWARYTDIGVFTLLGAWMASVFLPTEFLAYRTGGGARNAAIYGFVVLAIAVAFALDALAYQCFRTTPAKALLGVRVLNRDGGPLTAGQYWRRNSAVFAMGYCFGIPLLAWITMLYNERRLTKTGYTAWDVKWGYQVMQEPRAPWRVVVFGVFFFVVQYLSYWNHFNPPRADVVRPYSEAVRAGAPTTATATPQLPVPQLSEAQLATMKAESEKIRFSQNLSWINPVTLLPARLPDVWSKIIPNDASHSWTFFYVMENEKRADMAVLFFHPRKENQDLRDFANSQVKSPGELKERTASNRRVIYLPRDGRADGGPYFTDSEFWESKEGFWTLRFSSDEAPHAFNIFDPQELVDLLMASTPA